MSRCLIRINVRVVGVLVFAGLGLLFDAHATSSPLPVPNPACARQLIHANTVAESIRLERSKLRRVRMTSDGLAHSNSVFVEAAENNLARSTQGHVPTDYVLHLEFLAQKELNSASRLGFDPTTEVTGLFQDLAMDLIENDPRYQSLKPNLDLKHFYADDKTLRVHVKRLGNREADLEVRKSFASLIQHVGSIFGRKMREHGWEKLIAEDPSVWRGHLQTPEKWIVGGVGDTWAEADMAARLARFAGEAGGSGLPAFVDFNQGYEGQLKVESFLTSRLNDLRAVRRTISGPEFRRLGLTRTFEGTVVLTPETFAVFRKFVPTRREMYFKELADELRRVFGIEPVGDETLTDIAVRALHRVYQTLDQVFKPGFLKTSARPLPSISPAKGGIASDFTGVGALNLAEADKSVVLLSAKHKAAGQIPAASFVMAGRDAIARADFKIHSRQTGLNQLIKALDPASASHYTADDGVHLFEVPPSKEAVMEWFRTTVFESKEPKVADHRMVFVEAGFSESFDPGTLRDFGFELIKRYNDRAIRGVTVQETKDVLIEPWKFDSSVERRKVDTRYLVSVGNMKSIGILAMARPGASPTEVPIIDLYLRLPDASRVNHEELRAVFEQTKIDLGPRPQVQWGQVIFDRAPKPSRR